MMDLKLLTQKEVCELLKLSQSAVDNLRKTGAIPYIKIGSKVYLREQDIDAYIAANTYTDNQNN